MPKVMMTSFWRAAIVVVDLSFPPTLSPMAPLFVLLALAFFGRAGHTAYLTRLILPSPPTPPGIIPSIEIGLYMFIVFGSIENPASIILPRAGQGTPDSISQFDGPLLKRPTQRVLFMLEPSIAGTPRDLSLWETASTLHSHPQTPSSCHLPEHLFGFPVN